MSEPLRVLQVEDSESDAALILRLLKNGGYDVRGERVEDPNEMWAALKSQTWDVIISDHRMGQFDAPGALRILHETGQDIPFIIVSGSIGEELAVRMMKSGAHDYLLKNNLARLVPAVDREIREARARRDRRQAEKDLRDSEERLALAIEATQLGTFDFSPETGRLVCSDLTRRHFGLPPDAEVSPDTFRRGLHPDDREQADQMVKRLLQPGSNGQYAAEYRTIGIEDGVERWISSWGRVFFDPLGRPVRFVGVTLDVTERKRLEEQFQRAQLRLRQIVVSSPAVLFTLAIEGNEIRELTWSSDNVREILGYAPEAAIGLAWWTACVHPDDLERVRAAAHADLFTRGFTTQEYRFRHGDGSYRWTRSAIRLIREEAGPAREAVGAWSDITDQKRAEEEQTRLREQLQQAQKLESVGRLAGGVAHDFNNLLTVINGYTSMLLEELTPDNPMHESVMEIKIAGERGAALSQQLLVLSRKNVVQQKYINLNDIIVEVEKMLGRVIGEDVRLESALSPSLQQVQADPGQLHQVLMNLAVNARDAMPGGGTLRIETANVDFEEGGLPAGMTPGRYIQLKVSDTGIGMSKDVQSHLFEPFFTTKEIGKGTGLGLATVYGIVKQCGGSILADSEPGRGTVFTIHLPRADAVDAEETAEPVASMLRGTETILVVEDQEQLRVLAGRMLRRYGYRVLEAADSAEAQLHSKNYEGEIHLMLTDIVMPGLSGLELADLFKAQRPLMKVVFMSGYSDRAVARSLELAGIYLAKPFSPTALASKVREVLDTP
jgi:PAS domain S-box-containing protein